MTPAEKLSKELKKAGSRKKPSGRARGVRWANNLRDMRRGLDLMSADIGGAIGLSIATVNTAETGFDPKLSTAMKLAAFYGKRIEEIWTALPEDQ